MSNLKTLTVKELKVIAKENEIALSYTENGKRHTLNKPELIAAIEAKQAEKVVNEVTPATVENTEMVTNEVLLNNIESDNSVKDADTVIKLLSLNEVVSFATNKLKEITCLNELKEFKTKLFKTFESKHQTKKRTLKSKWALQYNRLTMLFTQYERKLAQGGL